MQEASFEFLTLNRALDRPEIGELRQGEATINIVDGRLWVGDEFSVPVEIGGNAQESLISDGERSNYISIEVSDPGVFPIKLPDSNNVTPGTYRELFLHLYYPEDYALPDVELPVTHLTSPVEWDGRDQPDENSESPLFTLRGAGKHLVVKFFAFGPRQFWFGKVIWVSR